jgi:methyl-accepting chemotaxis protein WspA
VIRFNQLKISSKLLLLLGFFVVGFVAFALVAYSTLNRVKVRGPVYTDIVKMKDIIADVLPPPEYIIESYLLVLQLTEERDPAKIRSLIERGNALQEEYKVRHEYWVDEKQGGLEAGAIKTALVKTAYDPAIEFFRIRKEQFLPMFEPGADRTGATALATGALKEQYELHRGGVDTVVKLSNEAYVDFEKAGTRAVDSGTAWLVGLGVAVLALAALIAFMTLRLARNLTRRIEIATDAASRVAEGDLTVTIQQAASDDETGTLLMAIKKMSGNLDSLVSRVKQSSIELMSTATQFAATSTQQENTVAGFGASTTEIAAAVKEISATSQELLSTMEGVNSVSMDTARLAEHGRTALQGMDTTMRGLANSTSSISGKLSVIREKAADINLVVTTITKVADQTNLLSVNAAIEAEKAGEYGLGFLVLAREIRRLADQTAVATLNIEQMVRQMQAAVSAGVMEMDKFTEEVRRGVSSVGDISGQLGTIIGQVQHVSERFEAVNEGMRSQSQGAKQINEAMVQLTDGARTTASSLREFNKATDHLRSAVTSLKQEISHFKVSDA